MSTDEETIESHQPLIAAPQGYPHANSMTLTLNICAQEKSRSSEHPEKPWKEISGRDGFKEHGGSVFTEGSPLFSDY